MSKKIKPDGSQGGGRPPKDPASVSPYSKTRNLTRSAAEITRQHGVPLEMIAEFQNAVLAGHSSATIQQDDDGEWYVTWEEGELASSLEQKQRAAEFLVQRGYGMPAQTVHVEQEMRVSVESTSIQVHHLSPAAIAAIASLRRALLPASVEHAPATELPSSGAEDSDPNMIEAEFEEIIESASRDHDADVGEDDESASTDDAPAID